MTTIDIPERNLHVEFPSGWDELTNEQFAFIIKQWIKLVDGKINEDEFKLLILYNLLGIERSPFQDWKDKRLSRTQLEEKFANIWQLTETLNWLIRIEQTDKGPVGCLDYTGIENRMPYIESEWAKLEGPADCLLNITFGEYRAAWGYFEAYTRDRKHTDLDHLVAVLYRPSIHNYESLKYNVDWDGQTREKFNPHLTSHYAELIERLSFWQKYAVYLWFGNCDRFLKEDEDGLLLNGKPLSFAPLFKKTNPDAENSETLDETDLGLTGLLYSIAESKLFGNNIADVDKADLIDVLTSLIYWKQQASKIS